MSGDSSLERYQRQMLYAGLGESGQRRLAGAAVGVVGCGALGSLIVTELVRGGVGRVRVIDRDFPDLTNLHRQILFDEADVRERTPKVLAAARRLRAANSQVEVEPVVGDLNPFTIDDFAQDLDLLVDGTDNYATRYLVNDWAVKNGVPWVYGGVIGSSGMTMTIVPGEGPCFRCLFPEPPLPGQVETCDTAGVLVQAVGVIASLESAEAFKLLVEPELTNRQLLTLDVWDSYFEWIRIPRRDDCRTCGRRDFPYLSKDREVIVEHLCGSDAFQIVRPETVDLDLDSLATRLEGAVTTRSEGLYLEFEAEGATFTVFADGRALIRGGVSEDRAKALYDRFVGS
ncbi:MAG: molybdopterin-synthase adenylyltransferase MoeB [Thermoleophilia bacterium]